jgi:acetyl-CoA carboxylase biotin carboxyl carrier protein
MDFKAIKKLIDLVQDSGISELCIEENNTKIEIKKHAVTQHVTVPVQAAPTQHVQFASTSPISSESLAEKAPESNPDLVEIKAQMVGTFYSAASPDAAPYIKVGDSISEGHVLCIIEAMKLFNEIESEISGTVEKVFLTNGNSVEFGQPLFLVRKG